MSTKTDLIEATRNAQIDQEVEAMQQQAVTHMVNRKLCIFPSAVTAQIDFNGANIVKLIDGRIFHVAQQLRGFGYSAGWEIISELTEQTDPRQGKLFSAAELNRTLIDRLQAAELEAAKPAEVDAELLAELNAELTDEVELLPEGISVRWHCAECGAVADDVDGDCCELTCSCGSTMYPEMYSLAA